MSINPDRVARRTQRVFFAAYGSGPWECYFNDGTITSLGKDTRDGNIHHLDGDAGNDVASNLVIAHVDCHQRYFHPITEEACAKISAKLKGRSSPTKGMTFSAETKAKMSIAQQGERNSFYGHKHDINSLSKMRTPRSRQVCPDCGVEYAKNWLTRHKREGKCIKQ